MKIVLLMVSIFIITPPHRVLSTVNNDLKEDMSIESTNVTKLHEYFSLVSSTSEKINGKLETPYKGEILLYKVLRKLKTFWNQDDENNFTGRCLRLAKQIRSMIPIAVFLMGVIMTLLGFLTLFSLKSLGLLGALLLINTSGAVAKLTAAAVAHKGEKRPSTVHFHIHKDEDYHGGYHVGHTSPGHDWDRKSQINQEIKELDRLESYNLYNKLLNDLALKNYNI